MGANLSEEAKVMMRGRLVEKPSLVHSMSGEPVSRFAVVREVGPASCPVDFPFYVKGELAKRCGTNLFEGDLIEVTADLSMRILGRGRRRQRDYGALVEDVRLKQRASQAQARTA